MTDILEKSQARQRLRSLSEALDSGALKQVARILNGGLSPSDIAHLLESSPPRQRALLWNLVDKQLGAPRPACIGLPMGPRILGVY